MLCESVRDVLALSLTHRNGFNYDQEVYKALLKSNMDRYKAIVSFLTDPLDFSFYINHLIEVSIFKAYMLLDDLITMSGFSDTLDIPPHHGILDNIFIIHSQDCKVIKLTDYLIENNLKVNTLSKVRIQKRLGSLVTKLTQNPLLRGKTKLLAIRDQRFQMLSVKANVKTSFISQCFVYDDERGYDIPLISYLCEILPKDATFLYFKAIEPDLGYSLIVSSLRRLYQNGTFQERIDRILPASTINNFTLMLKKNPSYQFCFCRTCNDNNTCY